MKSLRWVILLLVVMGLIASFWFSQAAMAALLEKRPEIIVLGTGAMQRFAAPAVLRPLIEAGGKGLDIVSGTVTGNRAVMGINRAKLNGAMVARAFRALWKYT